MYNKKIKSILGVVLIFVISFCMVAYNLHYINAIDIGSSENRKKQLEQQSAQLTEKLNQAKKETADASALHQMYLDKINIVEEELGFIEAEIYDINNEIDEITDQIDSTQAKIDDKIELLKQRIRGIYMAGETSTLDILLHANDIKDFLDKATILKAVSKHDKKLISELNGYVVVLADKQAQVANKKVELESSKNEVKAKKEELNQLSIESGIQLANLQGKQNDLNSQLKSAEDEIEKMNRQIEEYYKNKEKDDNKPKPDPGPGPGPGPSPSDKSYYWPCDGFHYISSYFGEDRGGTPHKGIDIAGGGIYGTPIRAAQNGTINSAWYSNGGWGGGYGTYCMIDHDAGSNRATLYAHMSKIVVSPGQHVSRGQVIGYVGTTGQSTGPHLHFECRQNGKVYNPLSEY